MGIGPFKVSRSVYDRPAQVAERVVERVVREPVVVKVEQPRGNPDPWNFRVVRARQVGSWAVVEAVYPDCRNYEGRKIMLYRNASAKKLAGQKHLDPHFSSSRKFPSPFARFEPTDAGWGAAEAMALFMESRGKVNPDDEYGGA